MATENTMDRQACQVNVDFVCRVPEVTWRAVGESRPSFRGDQEPDSVASPGQIFTTRGARIDNTKVTNASQASQEKGSSIPLASAKRTFVSAEKAGNYLGDSGEKSYC